MLINAAAVNSYFDDLALYSELYKDLYGVRPGNTHFESHAALNAAIGRLSTELQKKLDAERGEEAKAIAAFEAVVAKLISQGAGDRATALRWLMDSTEARDLDTLEFEYDLPYGYLAEKESV